MAKLLENRHILDLINISCKVKAVYAYLFMLIPN